MENFVSKFMLVHYWIQHDDNWVYLGEFFVFFVCFFYSISHCIPVFGNNKPPSALSLFNCKKNENYSWNYGGEWMKIPCADDDSIFRSNYSGNSPFSIFPMYVFLCILFVDCTTIMIIIWARIWFIFVVVAGMKLNHHHFFSIRFSFLLLLLLRLNWIISVIGWP